MGQIVLIRAVKPDVAAQLNPANPADASYAKMAEAASAHDFEIALHEAGLFDSTTLANSDVLVIPHASSPEWEQTIQSGSAKFTDDERATNRVQRGDEAPEYQRH